MEDLVGYFQSGCKPESQWRIGTEHEKFAFRKADSSRATYEDIRYILEQVVARHGWEPIVEGDNVVGCLHDGKSITIESGGQVELSGKPLWNLHQTRAELASHLREVRAIAAEIGVRFVGSGTDPASSIEDVAFVPKQRYRILDEYLTDADGYGRELLLNTTSTQVNLDYSSEKDMADKLRISLALQPAAIALFANSAIRHGSEARQSCWRSSLYLQVDSARVGMLPFVFSPDFGFEAYAQWALDTPMLLAYRGGTEVNCNGSGRTFTDFVAGDMPMLPGEVATIQDFADHLGTMWPEVRLKKFLEMRGADCGSERMIAALPALWVGLLYDDEARAECLRLIEGWTPEDMVAMRHQVPIDGLCTVAGGVSIREVAAEIVRISRGGLRRRGLGEGIYLNPLDEIIACGESRGESIARRYRSEFGGRVEYLLESLEL